MRIAESKLRQIVRSEILKEMDNETSRLRLINDAVEGVKVYSDLRDPTRLLFVIDNQEKVLSIKSYLASIEDMGIFSHSTYSGEKNILVPRLPEGHVEVRCFPEACDAIANKTLLFIERELSL